MTRLTNFPGNVIIISATALLLLSMVCAKIATASHRGLRSTLPSQDMTISRISNYKLVWSDEFAGNSIDTTNWNFQTGGHGWGNHEKEYYQRENASVTKGNLVITAKKQHMQSNDYTSVRMTTKGKHDFKYGRMEARIKLPVAQGLWPAFWMLGANIDSVAWPACGETDIMEHINRDNIVYGTIHWDNNGHVQFGGKTTTTPADYHVYSVEWDSASIRWSVDGVIYKEASILDNVNSTEEFHQPFFIILNLAVGGDWPGQAIDDKSLPAKMYVDYVRVYQQQ